MAKHTKSNQEFSPWRVSEESLNAYEGHSIVDGTGNCVAVTVTKDEVEVTPREEANARLIASAPELLRQRDELLEVVTEAYKWLDRCGEKAAGNYLTQNTVAREAIEKALTDTKFDKEKGKK